ncbi:hypothetical protein MRX96_036183 [Rhipicephalus microplus]
MAGQSGTLGWKRFFAVKEAQERETDSLSPSDSGVAWCSLHRGVTLAGSAAANEAATWALDAADVKDRAERVLWMAREHAPDRSDSVTESGTSVLEAGRLYLSSRRQQSNCASELSTQEEEKKLPLWTKQTSTDAGAIFGGDRPTSLIQPAWCYRG